MKANKFGIYIWEWQNWEFVSWFERAQPTAAVCMDLNEMNVEAALRVSPNTRWIFRDYAAEVGEISNILADPRGSAERAFNQMWQNLQKMQRFGGYWLLPINEPWCRNDIEARALNTFAVVFCEAMHRQGFKVGGPNYSTGQPEMWVWPYQVDMMRAFDVWTFHEYNAPWIFAGPDQANGGNWLALRHRRSWGALVSLGVETKQTDIIEWSLDGGVSHVNLPSKGWKLFCKDASEFLEKGFIPYNEAVYSDPHIGAVIVFANHWRTFARDDQGRDVELTQGTFDVENEPVIRDYIGLETLGPPVPDVSIPYNLGPVIALERALEHFAARAYPDGRGHFSIGYGHQIRANEQPLLTATITREQAIALLLADVPRFAAAIASAVKVPLNEREFEALVSFCYNVGIGSQGTPQRAPTGFLGSTLLERLNQGDRAGAAREMLWYDAQGQPHGWVFTTTASGQKVVANGLIERRSIEQRLFSS